MHGVGEHHRLAAGPCVQEAFIGLDEGLLPGLVELSRHRLRLAVLHPQTMKQRNQPRPALIDDGELPFDPRPDMACRARQHLGDPGSQPLAARGSDDCCRPRSRTRPAPRSRFPGRAGTTCEPYRRRAKVLPRLPSNSSPDPAARAHCRAAPNDARPSRREPTRSAPPVPSCSKIQREPCSQQESITTELASTFSTSQ